MKKLISLCNDSFTLNKLIKKDYSLLNLLGELNIDSVELLKVCPIQKEIFGNRVIGRHLFFYPMWMDFYLGKEESLIEEFKNQENIESFYIAKNKEEFTNNLRMELCDCIKDKCEYVVMHASHMNLTESFTRNYKYKSIEITKAFVEHLNKALEGINPNFDILIENNWYNGFNFLEEEIFDYYIDNVNYKKIGFLLDTSHLSHTNKYTYNQEEASKYILNVLKRLKNGKREYIKYIQGIHLNMCASGEYLEKADEKYKDFAFDESDDFFKKLSLATRHIKNFDKHDVYFDKGAKEIVDIINPKYLIYELGFDNIEEFKTKVKKQNQVLGI